MGFFSGVFLPASRFSRPIVHDLLDVHISACHLPLSLREDVRGIGFHFFALLWFFVKGYCTVTKKPLLHDKNFSDPDSGTTKAQYLAKQLPISFVFGITKNIFLATLGVLIECYSHVLFFSVQNQNAICCRVEIPNSLCTPNVVDM